MGKKAIGKSIAVIAVIAFILLLVLISAPTILKYKMQKEEKVAAMLDANRPANPHRISNKYFVGFDYSHYDLYGMSPIVMCKIRYDKKLETSFAHTDENGVQTEEVCLFDLSDEQYSNIVNRINPDVLYELDPEPSDVDEVMDGGSSWLVMYGADDSELRRIGGFCPRSETFKTYRRTLFDNLPNEFKEAYNEYDEEVMATYMNR